MMSSNSVQEVYCPHCHGGNAPNTSVCQWCGRSMWRKSTPLRQFGGIALIAMGGLVLLSLLVIVFPAAMPSLGFVGTVLLPGTLIFGVLSLGMLVGGVLLLRSGLR
jgi:hypothetical protein